MTALLVAGGLAGWAWAAWLWATRPASCDQCWRPRMVVGTECLYHQMDRVAYDASHPDQP